MIATAPPNKIVLKSFIHKDYGLALTKDHKGLLRFDRLSACVPSIKCSVLVHYFPLYK